MRHWSTFAKRPTSQNGSPPCTISAPACRSFAGSAGLVAAGNFGDAKSVGGAVSELRIDHGPGNRVYFTRRGKAVVILICGGDKRTQSKDIRKAQEIAETLED